MAWLLGEWSSPSVERASLRFHRERLRTLDAALPPAVRRSAGAATEAGRELGSLQDAMERFRAAEARLQPPARRPQPDFSRAAQLPQAPEGLFTDRIERRQPTGAELLFAESQRIREQEIEAEPSFRGVERDVPQTPQDLIQRAQETAAGAPVPSAAKILGPFGELLFAAARFQSSPSPQTAKALLEQEKLGPTVEAIDVPRQIVKREVIEPVVPEFGVDVPREAVTGLLGPIGQAVEVGGLISEAAGGPELPETIPITSGLVEEAASWVVDPINLAFMAGPALKAAGGAVRVANQIRKSGKIPQFVRAALKIAGEEAGGRPPTGPLRGGGAEAGLPRGGAPATDRLGGQFTQASLVDTLPDRLRRILARFGIGVMEERKIQIPAGASANLKGGRIAVNPGQEKFIAHEAGHIVDNDLRLMERLADESDDVIKELRLVGEPSSQPLAPHWREQLAAGDRKNIAGEAVAERLGEWINNPAQFARDRPRLTRIFNGLLGEPAVPPGSLRGGVDPHIAKADPGSPPPPRKPPAGPRGPGPDDPQFNRIQEVAIKGEKPEETLLRGHGGAINTSKIEARIAVEEGNALLREAKMGQSLRGTVVAKTGNVDEFDELFRLLHNPSRVTSGELTVPSRLRPMYNKLRDLTDWEQAARLDFDPEMALVEDYFFRGWKPPEGMFTGVPVRGQLGRTPGFKLPRVNATFEEMRAAGFEPLFWNPFEQWRFSRMSGIRYREQMRLIDDIKELGLAIPDAGGSVPKGWRVPRVGSAFEGKPFAILDEADKPRPMFTRRWVVPDTLADRLENAYGVTPQLGKVELFGKAADLLKVVDVVTFLPKRAKLFGSVFQHVDFLTRSGIGSWTGFVNALRQGQPIEAMMHLARWPQSVGTILRASVSPGYRQNLRRLALDTTPLVEGRPGLTMRSVTEAGLGLQDVTILPANIDEIAREAAQEAVSARAIKAPGRALAGVERISRQNLFDGVYPAAILTDVKNNIAPIMVRNFPDLNDAQLAAQIAKAASIKYSTVPGSMSVVQNRFLRNFFTRVFFSLNENEGLLRQATGALRGPQASFWRDHWLGVYVGLISTANVIHFASTGELLPFARYSPISTTKFGPLPFGYNRDFAAPNIPLTGRSGTEITLDLVGQLDTALRLLDPAGFISARESVPLRAGLNQITGEDFFGAPIDEIGPGGVVSRTSQLIFDLFAPIGVGQAGLGVARDKISGAENIIQPGEQRLGVSGLGVQATGVNLRAETTPQLLARVRAEVMREMGFQGAYTELDSPRRAQVDDAVEGRVGQELGMRRQTAELRGQITPAGQFFEESDRLRAEFTVEQESDDAAFTAGTMEPAVWRERYRDRAREQFARRDEIREFLGVEFEERKPSNRIDAAIVAYFAVDIDEFTDISTGETDWDGFFNARDKALVRLSASDRRDVLNFIRRFDTQTVTEFREAQNLRSEAEENISRVIGLQSDEYSELQQWLAERVAPARRSWLENNGVQVSLEDAVRAMADRDGKGPNFTRWALLLRSRIPDELRNPRFDEFLIENEAVLRRFLPELYESQRILEQLGAR